MNQWVATSASPTHPERNEDHMWIAASGRAAAVIDGMGGYRRRKPSGEEVGGEHASALAARILAEQLDGWDGTLSRGDCRAPLRAAIEAVNAAIWQQLNGAGRIPAGENPEGKPLDELTVGVAMTLVALCDGGARAMLGQHGDTHGYIFKATQGLIQVTADQDRLAWDLMNGTISQEEAEQIASAIDQFDGVNNLESVLMEPVRSYYFDKNIFGALGVAAECAETDWSVIRLDAGDRLALLSDGAYSNLSLPELNSLLAFPDDPADVVLELAQQRSLMARFPDVNDAFKPFNMRSTQDDITIIVLEVGDEPVAAGATVAARGA